MHKLTRIVISLMMIILLFEGSVSASHPYSPKRHLTGMHSSTINEWYCVDASDPNITLTTVDAYTAFRSILWFKNYDGLASNKVYWKEGGSGTTACSSMTAAELSTIQYRYYIQLSTTPGPSPYPACDGTSGCVNRYGGVLQADGHTHYDYGWATISNKNFTGIRDAIVNHETGHLLGMIDGTGSTCPTPASIMHYACNYPSNPTQADLDSVTAEANSN